jgi:type IV pilus assembly protein PilB
MSSDNKKLGEMLVEAGLINPAQLQEALRHQRIAGGRMGSNLVALGFVTEDVLMDFLAHQTGVPRLDLHNLDVPAEVLKRIPRRLADQLNVLPVGIKEPKSLVLAMADPSDLNAIDSARFASGLNIEPVVVSHSALKIAIPEQYRKLDAVNRGAIEVGAAPVDESLPVNFQLSPQGDPRSTNPPIAAKYARDPFFDENPTAVEPPQVANPFSFFAADPIETLDTPLPPARMMAEAPLVIHARSAAGQQARRLDTFQTRTLVLGLIKMLQRRGILGDDELQRFITNLLEAGEIKDDDRASGGPSSGSSGQSIF